MNTPKQWRLRQVRYKLLGSICFRCDRTLFPPRPLCPECFRTLGEDAKDGNSEGSRLSAQYVSIHIRKVEQNQLSLTYKREEDFIDWN
jgi:predicted amidophosphoribosyltransferase